MGAAGRAQGRGRDPAARTIWADSRTPHAARRPPCAGRRLPAHPPRATRTHTRRPTRPRRASGWSPGAASRCAPRARAPLRMICPAACASHAACPAPARRPLAPRAEPASSRLTPPSRCPSGRVRQPRQLVPRKRAARPPGWLHARRLRLCEFTVYKQQRQIHTQPAAEFTHTADCQIHTAPDPLRTWLDDIETDHKAAVQAAAAAAAAVAGSTAQHSTAAPSQPSRSPLSRTSPSLPLTPHNHLTPPPRTPLAWARTRTS